MTSLMGIRLPYTYTCRLQHRTRQVYAETAIAGACRLFADGNPLTKGIEDGGLDEVVDNQQTADVVMAILRMSPDTTLEGIDCSQESDWAALESGGSCIASLLAGSKVCIPGLRRMLLSIMPCSAFGLVEPLPHCLCRFGCRRTCVALRRIQQISSIALPSQGRVHLRFSDSGSVSMQAVARGQLNC